MAVQHERTIPVSTLIAPEAFAVEYESSSLDKALYNDLVSYLGEYRFNLQTYSYKLKLREFSDGVHICSDDDDEPMIAKIQRGIDRKLSQHKNPTREIADIVGMQRLEAQLAIANQGDFVTWWSPPTPGSDEYGDHGFLFLGRLKASSIDMHAIRIEDKDLSHYNAANRRITGISSEFNTPEDFVANPVVFSQFADSRLTHVLYGAFGFQEDPHERTLFDMAVQHLHPYITTLIQDLKSMPSRADRIAALNKLEYLAQETWKHLRMSNASGKIGEVGGELREMYAAYQRIRHDFNFSNRLETASGSCGGGSTKSTNPFTRHSALEELIEGKDTESCTVCDESANDHHYHCPDCNRRYESEIDTAPEARTKQCECGFAFAC